MNTDNRTAAETFHPGTFLREELAARGMTLTALAAQTVFSIPHLSHVRAGHDRISPNMALALERALGIPAEVWVNLQGAWDTHQARQEVARLRGRAGS